MNIYIYICSKQKKQIQERSIHTKKSDKFCFSLFGRLLIEILKTTLVLGRKVMFQPPTHGGVLLLGGRIDLQNWKIVLQIYVKSCK